MIGRANNYITPSGKHKTKWICRCNCSDKLIEVVGASLLNGSTKSCGCLRKDKLISHNKKYNDYDLSGEYGIGYDSKGQEFYFDLNDYDKIKDYCWLIDNHGYVITKDGVSFHGMLYPNAEIVDHRNHKTYDNRRRNLREVTCQMNMMNSKKQSNNTSSVTGVVWHKKDKKWQAQISYCNKCIYLGSYEKFDDAVIARKQAEEKYFGEYSYDNSMKVEDIE